MKDAVKITVIATGFREAPATRHRHQETRVSFAAAHDEAMDFPDALGPRDPTPEPPKHIMSEPDMSHERMSDDRSFVEEPAPSQRFRAGRRSNLARHDAFQRPDEPRRKLRAGQSGCSRVPAQAQRRDVIAIDVGT